MKSLAFFVLFLSLSAVSVEASRDSSSNTFMLLKSPASIKRIVETRKGIKSCWGLVIQLKDLYFNKSVSSNELMVIDGKHFRDLKDIMLWYVDKSGKKLIIKFKKGCGDFGSGNVVEVRIKSTALTGSGKENIKVSVSTDI